MQNHIDAMIQRRHRIVHEADANSSAGRGHHRATPVNLIVIQKWAESVKNLVAIIDQQ